MSHINYQIVILLFHYMHSLLTTLLIIDFFFWNIYIVCFFLYNSEDQQYILLRGEEEEFSVREGYKGEGGGSLKRNLALLLFHPFFVVCIISMFWLWMIMPYLWWCYKIIFWKDFNKISTKNWWLIHGGLFICLPSTHEF